MDRNSRGVLVSAPIGRDGQLTVDILTHAGIRSTYCGTLLEMTPQLDSTDCLVMTEESLLANGYSELQRGITAQPAWSDIPVILITLPGSNSATVKTALEHLGNVALVERPLSASALVSLVRAGLRARTKQYEVRDQIERLNDATASLQSANQAKDELLALVSHELRTPLVSILGLSEVLVRRPNLDAEVRAEAQAQVFTEAHRLHRIVDNMLVLAHAETVGDVAAEPMLLHRSLGQIVHRLESIPRTHELVLTMQEDMPPALGNETYLDQVVSNLVHNAEKYASGATPIMIDARQRCEYLEIVVRNDGQLIPPEAVERLFRAFERGEQADGPIPGLGLGLAVCKRLMEAQRGQIAARALPQGGLEVRLRFAVASID
ncbi:hypothetical protein AYO38_10910 [bacterium SCGC AG-212-C10]|nr:hypothetical protein AYO38_10910 [bacterium SCGC AG-212-C10]